MLAVPALKPCIKVCSIQAKLEEEERKLDSELATYEESLKTIESSEAAVNDKISQLEADINQVHNFIHVVLCTYFVKSSFCKIDRYIKSITALIENYI